jgi:hypothetical protein
VVKHTILWVYHQEHCLVSANLNSVVGIPDKTSECKLWVFVLESVVLKSVGVSENSLLTLHSDVICLVDVIIVETGLRQDGELALVLWVELSMNELLWLARKLGLWDNQLLIVFQIENGNLEVWDSSNHEEVFAASRKSEGDALDSCIHGKLMFQLFSWYLVDMHLWIKSIFSTGNKARVIVGGSHAVSISLGPIIKMSLKFL